MLPLNNNNNNNKTPSQEDLLVKYNLNIYIQKSIITVNEKHVLINNSKIHIDKLNIKIIKRDEGTGYHIKEGILLHYGAEISKHIEKYKDSEIDTTFIHDIILDFFDLKIHK